MFEESTMIQRTVWQLAFVSQVHRFVLLQNKRHSRWTSARELRLCIGVLGVSTADAQVMLGGLRPGPPHPVASGHDPHCKRPRGPPPAHFPSDPAFVPRGLVVGAVAC